MAAESERWTPCPAERRAPERSLRMRRSWARAARRRAVTSAERAPCFQRARRLRARPAGVRGPVLRPPWRRQRPLHIAGWRHSPPQRVRAPQRGAARKSPAGLPFFNRPRREDGSKGKSERSTPCPAGHDAAVGDLTVRVMRENVLETLREQKYNRWPVFCQRSSIRPASVGG